MSPAVKQRLVSLEAPTVPEVSANPRSAASIFPAQPFHHLDALWIQVAGTLCNLTCTHCFVSCGPGETRHGMMSRAQVRDRITEALPLGVKEFYFTGGEPFLNPEMLEIASDALAHGPVTVLTNGTLLTTRRVAELARLSGAARYSLEIRVSLDGATAAEHDSLRGPGGFARALEGLRRLDHAGLLPIVTATQVVDEDPAAFHDRYVTMLRRSGLRRPRLKTLPLFLLGRETRRSRDYVAAESLAGMGADFDATKLPCGSCRAVTSRGVFVCPLLVDEPQGRLGERLEEALRPFPLRHGACFTCYVTGATCANS